MYGVFLQPCWSRSGALIASIPPPPRVDCSTGWPGPGAAPRGESHIFQRGLVIYCSTRRDLEEDRPKCTKALASRRSRQEEGDVVMNRVVKTMADRSQASRQAETRRPVKVSPDDKTTALSTHAINLPSRAEHPSRVFRVSSWLSSRAAGAGSSSLQWVTGSASDKGARGRRGGAACLRAENQG